MATQQPNPFAPHWLIRDIVIGSHMAAVGPGGMLFIGDSIVEGFYWNRIDSCPVINAGYSGIWAEALQPKVQRLIDNAKPQVIALLVGTNDAKKRQTPTDIEAVAEHYEQIVETLAASGIPFIAITPPPVEAGKRLTSFYAPETMGNLSRRIVEIVGARQATIIDMYSAFRGEGQEAKTGVTIDGIHLAPKAYRALHDMLDNAVARMEKKTRKGFT